MRAQVFCAALVREAARRDRCQWSECKRRKACRTPATHHQAFRHALCILRGHYTFAPEPIPDACQPHAQIRCGYHAHSPPTTDPNHVEIAIGHALAHRFRHEHGADDSHCRQHEPLTEDVLQEIRAYLRQQRALGSSQFQAMIQAKTQRFAGIRPPHRPPRNH